MIAEEVDDEKTKGTAAENGSSSRKQVAGRPARSTEVHNMHKGMSDRPPGRPQEELDQPSGRPTESTQLSVGHPVNRPVDRWKRSVDRPVDRQTGRAAICRFGNLLYLKDCCWFLGFVSESWGFAGALLQSKRLLAIVIIFQVN